MWVEYTWIVVCGGFLSVFVAYGIGANDVANAFGSSVGSKALTIKKALMIAAVFEFSGALLLGASVTKTVRGGIADLNVFLETPELYMYGMLCVLLATGIWLILASYYELPVSTTHSVVGGVIGMAICARGASAVTWYAPSDEFPYVKGVASIVLSWLFSPILSGAFAAALYFIVRIAVLRSVNSYTRSWWMFPILVFLTVFINAVFIILKGMSSKLELDLGTTFWIAAVIGAGCAIIVAVVVVPFLKRKVDREFAAAEEKANNPEDPVIAEAAAVKAEAQLEGEEEKTSAWKKFSKVVTAGMNVDIHEAVEDDESVNAIHEFSERFDPKTEECFKYLQVFTAICDSFAHGANDVANSIGPFAAIWGIYEDVGVKSNSEVPVWILALGGFGIVLGLATFGYKIMCAIGVKMCRITPSRGFAIELGAIVVVIFGSYLGLPLSTTHCQVGATTGVGMMESITKGVNWKMVGKMVIGWVITLAIVGGTTAAFFLQAAYAPSIINLRERNFLQHSIQDNVVGMITSLNQTVYTDQVANLTDVLDDLSDTHYKMTNKPAKNLYAQAVPVKDTAQFLTEGTYTTLETLVPLSGGNLSVVNGYDYFLSM